MCTHPHTVRQRSRTHAQTSINGPVFTTWCFPVFFCWLYAKQNTWFNTYMRKRIELVNTHRECENMFRSNGGGDDKKNCRFIVIHKPRSDYFNENAKAFFLIYLFTYFPRFFFFFSLTFILRTLSSFCRKQWQPWTSNFIEIKNQPKLEWS